VRTRDLRWERTVQDCRTGETAFLLLTCAFPTSSGSGPSLWPSASSSLFSPLCHCLVGELLRMTSSDDYVSR
jgi:hypothetical protein